MIESNSTLLQLVRDGWRIEHEEGTAFVAMHSPFGGSWSLLEVKTGGGSGSPLSLKEADKLAKMLTGLVRDELHYEVRLGSESLP